LRTRPISPYFDIIEDDGGEQTMVVYLSGIALLRLVLTNKGTAFSLEERAALGIEGLLPSRVSTLEEQVERVYAGYRLRDTPIARYEFLRALQERHEILFFALLSRHLEEMLPVVYTPTVGEAVQQFTALYQYPRGLSLSPHNIHRATEFAGNYPMEDVRMIVVTDSSAILGIGDQGYGGLAIPIGKLALYTAAGGVSPFHTLPVSLDVGTSRADLIADPYYLGVRHERLQGEDYLRFVDHFVEMVATRWPAAVIQWEDLAKEVAFEVLERYRDRLPSFNDDIQGTGAVALAGVRAACALNGERLVDQRVVIHGAGAGGIGVAAAIRDGLEADGLSREEALARIFVLDSGGLLMEGRATKGYKVPFNQPRDAVAGWSASGGVPTLHETIHGARATVLLGLSGQPGAFDEAACRATLAFAARPIIFPLSNPTSSSEATPEDIFRWTDGRARVATGSPFEPVHHGGRAHPIGQGNNAFIFPGLGLGAILGYTRVISDAMVRAASDTLAAYTIERYGDQDLVYPPVADLPEVSQRVATAVVRNILDEGLGELPQRWIDKGALDDIEGYVRGHFWQPRYLPFIRGEQRPF